MEKALLKIEGVEFHRAVIDQIGNNTSEAELKGAMKAERRLGLAVILAAEAFYTESRIRRAKDMLGSRFVHHDPTRPSLLHRSSYPKVLEEI